MNRVFVLGAGASACCGFALTNRLLPEVLPLMNPASSRKDLEGLIEYLYAHFDTRWRNYPNLEEFLSFLESYLQLNEWVKSKHKYPNDVVRRLRDDLLLAVSDYLHARLDEVTIRRTKLYELARKLEPGDAVVTFNWDLTIERALSAANIESTYTMDQKSVALLKPHGSVDWLDAAKSNVKANLTFALIPSIGKIRVFKHYRAPHVKHPTLPVIIPPVFNKSFPYPEFRQLWKDTWRALRDAERVYIIGFSLPPEDLHVRFVMRSAIRMNEGRRGRVPIAVVNPDRGVYLRFVRLVESNVSYYECRFEDVPLADLLR